MFELMARKTGGIVATLFACAVFLLTLPAEAATVPVSNSVSFDHAKTGFQLRDIHTTLRCEQCHVEGIFKNTPRNCAGCHAIGSRIGATPKPAQHVQTNLECDACHTSPTSFLVKSYNHGNISDKCASCHNGQYPSVVSKAASHLPTMFPCENCHNSVTSFANVRMQHTGISSNCILCHNGQYPNAESRLPTHSSNSLVCESCHTPSITKNFTTWGGAFFDHNSVPVAGLCNTCHGVKPNVTAKPTGHFPTPPAASQCDSNNGCHSVSSTRNYTDFTGASYLHQAADSCSTCHTGSYTNALGKNPNHFPTTAQCGSGCHTAASTGNYTYFEGASYPHVATDSCSTCHTGTYANALGKKPNHVLTTSPCSKCHTSATTSNYTSFKCTPNAVDCYKHDESTAACSTCHNNVVALGKSSTHAFTTLACDACHKNNTSFLGATYSHGPTPGVCSSCHDGVKATGKPTFHVITASNAACDGSGCHELKYSHIDTATPTFSGVPYTHTPPIGVCSTCHDGTKAKGKSATHVVTGSPCSNCHTAATTTNYTSFICAPTPVTCYSPHEKTAACSTCHNGITAQGTAGPVAPPKPHISTNLECDNCHSGTTTFANGLYKHATPPGVCSTCHNGITAQGKFGPVAPATPHVITNMACDICHSNTTTFVGGIYKHSLTPGACITCHNGVIAMGTANAQKATAIAAHAASNGLTCDSCHTLNSTGNYTSWGAESNHIHGASDANKCQSCHNGVNAKGTKDFATHVPLPASTSCDAGGCHKISPLSFSGGLMNASGHSVVAASSCTTCHDDTKIYKGQGSGGGPFGVLSVSGKLHVPNPSALPCTNCHKSTCYSGKSCWDTVTKMDHNGAKTGCNPCHQKPSLYMVTSLDQKDSSHKSGKDCSTSNCHNKCWSLYTNWCKP